MTFVIQMFRCCWCWPFARSPDEIDCLL